MIEAAAPKSQATDREVPDNEVDDDKVTMVNQYEIAGIYVYV